MTDSNDETPTDDDGTPTGDDGKPTGDDGKPTREDETVAGDDGTVDGRDLEPDPDAMDHDELVYPTFAFEDGDVAADGTFDLDRDLDRDGMREWLAELAGGLGTHDVAVESPDGHVRLGVGAGSVEMAFDPDDDHRGELEVTLRLPAKAMFVADDPEKPAVGARGGRGFVPVEMLTEDREEYRCYNWIDDPLDPGGD